MPTPLDGDIQQDGELELHSPNFEDNGQMPDWTGLANENENPQLEISGVPENAAALVLVMDDQDAEPVVGHTFEHWLVWNIDPGRTEIPRDWDGDDAVQGFNDMGESAYAGPSPPDGTHTYRFKLLALADEIDAFPQIRRKRLASTILTQTEILAATQLDGTYDADQGNIFS